MDPDPFERASWRQAEEAEATDAVHRQAEEAWDAALTDSRKQACLLLAFVEALLTEGSPILQLTHEDALTLAAAVWRAS